VILLYTEECVTKIEEKEHKTQLKISIVGKCGIITFSFTISEHDN
jgi:hypothetical protein